jgi:hypothetical protein
MWVTGVTLEQDYTRYRKTPGLRRRLRTEARRGSARRSQLKTRMAQRVGVAVAGMGLLVGCKEKGEAPRVAASGAAVVAAPATETAAPSAAVGEGREAKEGPAGKTSDCGAKGKLPCPMQGWMKGVMASASSGGDGAALAKALTYVADHAPPEFGEWAAIAREGAAKAKAGDIDGAKMSCKDCHDRYKETYKRTMRDRAF